MGRPQHFSRDLPTRCSHLVQQLFPIVAEGKGTKDYGGPLTTTFLLAMAMPMLILPFERVRQPASRERPHGDDRSRDEGLTQRMVKGLDAPFRSLPFFAANVWSLVDTPTVFNTADALPDIVSRALSEQAGFDHAGDEAASGILQAVRHSLAHGGVMYLNADGQTSHDEDPIANIAFVSQLRKAKVEHLRVIRVEEVGFKDFLVRWAKWIKQSQLDELLDHSSVAKRLDLLQ